ncbi:MAG: hypothetical protein KHY57_10775 [Clostridium sp.]|nr:hypothetical protein [Clostridium sp.]
MWPKGYKYNGKKVFLESFQHINLLWMERNNLIHEMMRRTLGECFFEKKGVLIMYILLGDMVNMDLMEMNILTLLSSKSIWDKFRCVYC